MPRLISAYAIFDGQSGVVLEDSPIVTINCDDLAAYSPRPCAIKRNLAPGFGVQVNTQITFDVCDPEIDSNTLFGYAVAIDGKTIVLDVSGGVNAIVSACNACCDDEVPAVLSRSYTSGVPSFSAPAPTTYTLTRMDDGQPYDIQQATLDYLSQYFPGTFRHTGWQVSGVSTYTFQSYTVPVAIGSDVIS
jgi:hypothetical protein